MNKHIIEIIGILVHPFISAYMIVFHPKKVWTEFKKSQLTNKSSTNTRKG